MVLVRKNNELSGRIIITRKGLDKEIHIEAAIEPFTKEGIAYS
jgi:hypothetical protein